MIEHASGGREPGDDRVEELFRRGARARASRACGGAATLACGVAGGVDDPAISERRHEDLVASDERERTQHAVGAGRDVVDEHELVVGPEPDEFADRGGCLAHARYPAESFGVGIGEFTEQEARRLALDLVLQCA